MSNVEILIVSVECAHAIGDATDVPEMLRRAFKAAKNHWGVMNEDSQLKGALNAVLSRLDKGSPEHERLVTEVQLLGKFSAWLQAAQMGVAGDPPEAPEGHESFGVMSLWHETAR